MTDLAETAPSPPPAEWWDADRAATEIGVTRGTLYSWICRGKGPPYYRLNKAVRYRADEVNAWIEKGRHPGDGTIPLRPVRERNGRFARRGA